MTVCIDAGCALAFWMSQGAEDTLAHRVCGNEGAVPRSHKILIPQWAYAPDKKIHLVASSKSDRYQKKGFSCGVAEWFSPQAHGIYLGNGVSVLSPEACYLRLANFLTFPQLVKAGMLLCSCYSFNEFGELSKRFCGVTDANKLSTAVSQHMNIRGVKNARAALAYIAENAASPPEIDTSILLALSSKRGGYSCGKHELNGHIKLKPDAMRSLGYSDCYCDLLWRKERCAVEYTSKAFHESYEKQVKDEIRRTALEGMGYRVIFLTKNQLYNQVAFEGVAQTLRRKLGKRKLADNPRIRQARYELRKELLYAPPWIIRYACRL